MDSNKLDLKISKDECKAIFAILDQDDNGYISIDEFKAKLNSIREEQRQRELDRLKEEEERRK